jgi:hypothetical protein
MTRAIIPSDTSGQTPSAGQVPVYIGAGHQTAPGAGSGGGGGVAAFTASTSYTAGQQITQAGQLYAALANFTSGSSFNSANWLLLGQITDIDGGSL